MPFPSLRKASLGCLVLMMLFGNIPLAAQADERPITDFQTWQIGTVRGHITKRIMGYLDTQNNEVNLTNKQGNSAPGTHYGQILVRPAIGYQLTKGWSIWQGYGWTPSFQPQFRNENQIWEQLLYEHRFKYVTLSNRTRFEIRRIADAGGTSFRIRNQFRVAFPLGKTRWSLVAFDEPFYNLNTVTTGPRQGFNQNWAFIGIGRRITDHINLDVGYLNNYVRNFSPAPDRVNNVIFVSLGYNVPGTGFDLRRPNASRPQASVKDSQQQDAATSLLPVAEPNLEISPITTNKAALQLDDKQQAPAAQASTAETQEATVVTAANETETPKLKAQ